VMPAAGTFAAHIPHANYGTSAPQERLS
jgi:hypothetical protein